MKWIARGFGIGLGLIPANLVVVVIIMAIFLRALSAAFGGE